MSGITQQSKKQVDVEIAYLENLSQVNIDVLSVDGSPLSAQTILDAVSEALLLKYDNYDLDAVPDLDS